MNYHVNYYHVDILYEFDRNYFRVEGCYQHGYILLVVKHGHDFDFKIKIMIFKIKITVLFLFKSPSSE